MDKISYFNMINLEIPTLYYQNENSWKVNRIRRDEKDLEKPVLSEIFVSGTVVNKFSHLNVHNCVSKN